MRFRRTVNSQAVSLIPARRSRCLRNHGTRLGVVVLLGSLAFSVRGQAINTADFLGKLRQASERADGAYSQSKVIARRRMERSGLDTVATQVTLLTSGKYVKATMTREGLTSGSSGVIVATPTVSFEAHRRGDGKSSAELDFLSSRPDTGYARMINAIHQNASFCFGPHALIDLPLVEILTRKSTEIRSVERITLAGRPLIRVKYRENSEDANSSWDFADCQADLDPKMDLALIAGEIVSMKGGVRAFSQRWEMLSKPARASPTLDSAEFEDMDAKGKVVNRLGVEVVSTEFGPIPADQFTLAASGVTEPSYGLGGRLPGSLHVSIVLALLSLAGLVFLRRKRAKP